MFATQDLLAGAEDLHRAIRAEVDTEAFSDFHGDFPFIELRDPRYDHPPLAARRRDHRTAGRFSWRWAPTFVFIDQQAAEIHWQTLIKLAAFRSGGRKVELWILMSPAMISRGVAGSNKMAFAARVDALYGNREWRKIQDARRTERIIAEQYRVEMVNLLRWQLEHELGYSLTARIPMKMPSNMPIYDMVFATDHPVGNKIMTDLYHSAAAREPAMIREARARARRQREDRAGMVPLFDMEPELPLDEITWAPSQSWDPSSRLWW